MYVELKWPTSANVDDKTQRFINAQLECSIFLPTILMKIAPLHCKHLIMQHFSPTSGKLNRG